MWTVKVPLSTHIDRPKIMPLFTRRRLAECGEWGAYIRRRIHQVNGHADGILTEAGPDQIRDGSRLDVPAGFL